MADYTAPSLVVLAGLMAAGKSTYAQSHFQPEEIVSLDFCRGAVGANEESGEFDARSLFSVWIGSRCQRGLLTCVDATNLSTESRAHLLRLARLCSVPAHLVLIDVPLGVALHRNAQRLAPIPEHHFYGAWKRLQKARTTIYTEGWDSIQIEWTHPAHTETL